MLPPDHVTKSSAVPLRNQSVLSLVFIWVAQASAIWLGRICFYLELIVDRLMFWLGRGNSLGGKFSSNSPEVGWSSH